MKKRIVCVLLTLIMLLGLVPMGASAASHTTSAAAITVLKQMTSFKSKCYYFSGEEFRTGYGTVCEENHHFMHDATHNNIPDPSKQNEHTITEKNADLALREALKALDKKVNAFASANGLSLSQNQHDALVVFSFNAGTGWMEGNGVVKTVIINGGTSNELLNAMSLWTNNADMNRRKVEVNMYMNGIYSNTTSTNYIDITYYANGGYIAQGDGYTMYYDAVGTQLHVPVASHASKKFVGWYSETSKGTWIPVVHNGLKGAKLYARYMSLYEEITTSFTLDVTHISPKTVYKNGQKEANKDAQKLINGKTHVDVIGEYLDGSGNHWCKLADNAWVKVSVNGTGYVTDTTHEDVKWTVTVTNEYVNRRVNATAASAKNGSYKRGAKLDIIDEDDGWLQIGEVQSDGTVKAVGWVCAIYTDWGSVQEEGTEAESTEVIATATVTFNGYLNIRQEPGTDGKIVGALAQSDTVEIYEVKTVNGHKWGRTKSGWICLTYTSQRGIESSSVSDAGLKLYAFTGVKINGDVEPRVAAGPHNNVAEYTDGDNLKLPLYIKEGKALTLTNLVVVDGETWAKASWQNDEWKYNSSKQKIATTATRSGWIKLDKNVMTLDPIKYTVAAESINVRDDAGDSNNWIFSLNKGTQVEVQWLQLVGENIWGKITVKKTAESEDNFVGAAETGWINLASKYVSRDGVPTIEEEEASHETGKMATVVHTDSLRVRKTGATYATQIGSLSRGTTVAVWEYDDGWYKVDSNKNGKYDYDGDGWVSEDYVEISTGTTGGSSTVTDAAGNQYETDGTGKGIVANTYGGLNVRQGAGTNYAPVGKLLPGTVVEILETARGGKWGRTAQGWVSMDYITMVSYNQAIPETTPNGGTVVESFDKAEKTTTTAVYTGIMEKNATVYKTPTKDEQNAEKIRDAGKGENITIYELAKVTENITTDKNDVTDANGTTTTTTTVTTTTYWARINDGWIQDPETTITLNALDEKLHTQTDADTLKVRKSPETGAVIDALAQGDQVSVTALQIVKDKVWGRIETNEGTGWIRLDYMSEGAITVQAPVQNTAPVTPVQPSLGNGSSTGGFVTNTSGYRYTGKIINANEVNVRSTPSTAASKTTALKNGQALVIYETTIAENMAWGRCDAGWVYLYYVDLTPVVNGAVDARVVYNDNTIIYTDVNCSAVAGTYSRMSTIDIYEIVGKMARTDLGWVNTDNLL